MRNLSTARVVSVGEGGDLNWWDVESGEHLLAADIGGGGVSELCVDEASGRVALSTRSGELVVVGPEGRERARFELPPGTWDGLALRCRRGHSPVCGTNR